MKVAFGFGLMLVEIPEEMYRFSAHAFSRPLHMLVGPKQGREGCWSWREVK